MAQAPAATPPPAPQDCNAVKAYDWDVSTAHAICLAESRNNPAATGYNTDGSVDRGLMQINSVHADMVSGNLASLYVPSVNLAIAYKLYQAHGWSPWSTFNNGKYKEFE